MEAGGGVSKALDGGSCPHSPLIEMGLCWGERGQKPGEVEAGGAGQLRSWLLYLQQSRTPVLGSACGPGVPPSTPAPHPQPLSDQASPGKTSTPLSGPASWSPQPLLFTPGHAGGGLWRGEDLPACALQGWSFPGRNLHLHRGHRLSGKSRG